MDTDKLKYHFEEIYKACGNTFSLGCGSYLFDGLNYRYDKKLYYNRQKVLYDLAKESSFALEIGVYMGHSLLIMLLANPNISIVGIDIDEKYSDPAIRYLRKNFRNAKITFIKGNSLDILPNLIKKDMSFDLFHIDGNHENSIITKEFQYCTKLVKKNKMTLVLDDISCCIPFKNNILKNFKSEFFIPISKILNASFKINVESINNNSLKKFKAQHLKDELILFPKKKIIQFLRFVVFSLIYKLTSNKIIKLMKKSLYLHNLIKKIKSIII